MTEKFQKILTTYISLSGVGRKTASVVLNEGFGLPTIAVDTHVFRVSNRNRFSLWKKIPDEVQKKLYEVVPKKYLKKSWSYYIASWKIHLQSKSTFM